MDGFERTSFVGWGDADVNGHMRNTAFMDKGVDVRMHFFAEHGFPMSEFARLGFGPVIMKDEVEYFREMRLLEPVRITLLLAGVSDDGSRFRIRNEFWRPGGKITARLTSIGGWLDHKTRKLMPAPTALFDAIARLPRAEDFEVLPSSLKRRPLAGETE